VERLGDCARNHAWHPPPDNNNTNPSAISARHQHEEECLTGREVEGHRAGECSGGPPRRPGVGGACRPTKAPPHPKRSHGCAYAERQRVLQTHQSTHAPGQRTHARTHTRHMVQLHEGAGRTTRDLRIRHKRGGGGWGRDAECTLLSPLSIAFAGPAVVDRGYKEEKGTAPPPPHTRSSAPAPTGTMGRACTSGKAQRFQGDGQGPKKQPGGCASLFTIFDTESIPPPPPWDHSKRRRGQRP
jgi:hypothetical protein